MSGENDDSGIGKKFITFAGIFTVIFGGSVGTAFFTGYDTFKQVDVNTGAIAERITVNTFKRYTLTEDLEDAKAKLALFENMESLTLNQQAEIEYLQSSIVRWQGKLNDLDDE